VTRLCERPGCSAQAEVAYGFDADARAVWLDAFVVAVEARSGVLCRRHADAMVVPVGWSLDDRREPIPRLFRPAAAALGVAPPAAPRRRIVRSEETQQLQLGELVDDEAVGAGAAAAPDPDHALEASDAIDDIGGASAVADAAGGAIGDASGGAAAPWMPHFDHDDDLAGLLNPRGPLLSRAFGVPARRPDQ
jgi:hypothetical protein